MRALRMTRMATCCLMSSGIGAVGKITINNLFVFGDAVRVEQRQRFLVGFGLTCASTDRGNIFVLRNCFASRNRDVSGPVGLPNNLRSNQVIVCSDVKIAHGKGASLDRVMIMRATLRSGRTVVGHRRPDAVIFVSDRNRVSPQNLVNEKGKKRSENKYLHR